jgi:hypothetical protein
VVRRVEIDAAPFVVAFLHLVVLEVIVHLIWVGPESSNPAAPVKSSTAARTTYTMPFSSPGPKLTFKLLVPSLRLLLSSGLMRIPVPAFSKTVPEQPAEE